MQKQELIDIANTVMPFGKYKGRVLVDLPKEYLLWFARKSEFPQGRLGYLMEMMLTVKVEGPDNLVKLVKHS